MFETPVSRHLFLLSSGANPLAGPFGGLILGVLIGLVLLGGLLLAVPALLRRRAARLGELPEETLREIRADLVAKVGEASQTQGSSISLRGFWRGTGMTRPQRFVVLSDLLRRQVFYAVYSTDGVTAFVRRLFWDFLAFPVSWVRLSDQNWQRLASGASPSVVANGDVVIVQGSPGAGVIVNSPRSTQTITVEPDTEFVLALVTALRNDSQALMPGHALREQAESYADALENDAAAGRASSVKRTISSIVEFVSNGASLWVSTLSLLGQR